MEGPQNGPWIEEEMEEALDHLSPEERAERLNQWAQERAERLRMENAQYLELRRPRTSRTTMFWNEVLEKKKNV